MELNFTIFSNESSSNETSISKVDIEAGVHPLVSYLTLFLVSLGAIFVLVPTLAVIIIVLKNRKLKEKNNNIFYVNLLIADVLGTLSRWLLTSAIIISYLLNLPIVNCNVAFFLLYSSLFASRLMFLPVVFDRFLHVALPFSYKNVVTDKRVNWTIAGSWLLSLGFGLLKGAGEDYIILPQHGVCIPRRTDPSVFLIVIATLITSMCVITVTSIYLRHKIIHSNQFFNSVKRNGTEEQKAVRVGRLVEMLQEQVKPTFSVFIAGGIDVAFNILGMVVVILVSALGYPFYSSMLIIVPSQFCQYFSHAVLYAMRDNDIRKEIVNIYRNFRGSKRSKVIMLNGQ